MREFEPNYLRNNQSKYYFCNMIAKDLVVLLGTNQGDRVLNLNKAENNLQKHFSNTILKSSIYQTAAWGLENQPIFLNQVLVFSTQKPALEILEICQSIEIQLGRIRKEKWGPRVIDIDILFLGAEIIHHPTLIIPHPEIINRRFTLLPLVEILPDFVHPTTEISLSQHLNTCIDKLEVQLFIA